LGRKFKTQAWSTMNTLRREWSNRQTALEESSKKSRAMQKSQADYEGKTFRKLQFLKILKTLFRWP